MERGNQSTVFEFILLGLSDLPREQVALFVLFLVMYCVTIAGNFAIIALAVSDPRLHTPMYFLIGNLSFVDMCLTSITVPMILQNIISDRKSISWLGCMTQLAFFSNFSSLEVMLLAVMAYDRYVAICNPLHYTTVMSKITCLQLVVASWASAFLNSVLHTSTISHLSFCGPCQIQHYFCDIPPLLQLFCTDTAINELLIFTEATLIVLVSVLCLVVSYVRIVVAILKISSHDGRRRAFSICSSHAMVVTLFYGTIIFTYIQPMASYSLQKDKVVTVMYTVVTPLLNPFIYSLRNKQVKDALRKLIGRMTSRRGM